MLSDYSVEYLGSGYDINQTACFNPDGASGEYFITFLTWKYCTFVLARGESLATWNPVSDLFLEPLYLILMLQPEETASHHLLVNVFQNLTCFIVNSSKWSQNYSISQNSISFQESHLVNYWYNQPSLSIYSQDQKPSYKTFKHIYEYVHEPNNMSTIWGRLNERYWREEYWFRSSGCLC